MLCLLGRNGAGKTTLIRQITGDLKPSSGTVSILGSDPRSRRSRVRRRMGVIPQHVGLFETLTIRDHLKVFGALKDMHGTRLREEIDRVIALTQLKDLLPRKGGELSGGEQRKALLALALLADPEVLILDEPTVGLDPEARRVIWDSLAALRADGKAMLLTTHHLEEAEHLATQIAFINQGVLTRQGSVQSVFGQISSRVTLIDESSGEIHLADSVEAAQQLACVRGLARYRIGRESLEDVYLRLSRASTRVGIEA
jgi:ABC-2 type transport system ATP-binding protein